MAFFVGILDGADGVYGVRIPDVPGCHGGGETPEAAIADAISALCEMADQAKAAKRRSAAEIMADPASGFGAAAGESLVMLPLLAPTGLPVRVNISLDGNVLEAIDEAARRRGMTRSAFLVNSALESIGRGG